MTGQRSAQGPILDVISQRLNRLAEWVLAVLLAAMTLLVGAQVAGRFIFSYSIFWSDELARFLLVWISFLGISVGARRAAHPGVDSLVRALPAHWARSAFWLAIFASLVFFAVMVVSGAALVLRTWSQASTSLGIRMGIPYLAVPVCGLLMGVHAAALGVRREAPREPRGGPAVG